VSQDAGRRSSGGGRGAHPAWSGAAMFPAGVLGVHELRYLLAYGAHASHELTEHGDSYVGTASLLAGLLLALPAAGLIVGVMRARRGRAGGAQSRLGPWQSWLVWSAVLVVGFCAVEGLEMVLESEHPDGFFGVFGGGGWWALPAAAGVAALFTLVTRGARALVRRVARTHRRRPPWDAVTVWRPSTRPVGSGRRASLTPLASRAAGRAPPAVRAVLRQDS
jgi:hypothetical protein